MRGDGAVVVTNPVVDESGVAFAPLEQWARGAVEGDRDCTRRVVQAVAPSMAAALRAVLGPAASDLEDLCQEAVLGFLGALPAFRQQCSLRHYACRIAVRTALAARRRQRSEARRIAQLQQGSTELDAHGRPPDEEVTSHRRKEVLRALLAELPEAQAETLTLRVVLGYSIDDIAALTDVPRNTVRSRLRLAKEAMRHRIDSEPGFACARRQP